MEKANSKLTVIPKVWISFREVVKDEMLHLPVKMMTARLEVLPLEY